jgi:lipid II:glycine glycyltransferase (peptidoglycan interpeptide bridge formation enzyme)
MIDALKRGITRVNFFWIEGNFNNNHLLEFKSGFGGVVEEYVGGFEIVINKPKYMVRCIMRKGRALARRVRQSLSASSQADSKPSSSLK